MYIDVCYSGSCITSAIEWCNENGGKMTFSQDVEHADRSLTLKRKANQRFEATEGIRSVIYYFDCNCELRLRINTSCGENELANDAGESKGGLWTSYFMARGKNPKHHHGKQLKAQKPDGTFAKQTTQYLDLLV